MLKTLHLKFQNLLAHLVYDCNWLWIDMIICLLSEFEVYLRVAKDKNFKDSLDTCNICSSGTISDAELTIPQNTIYCEDCGYWTKSKIAEFFYGSQMCGYCYYLGKGDFSFCNPTELLWDGCKECQVSTDILEEEIDPVEHVLDEVQE